MVEHDLTSSLGNLNSSDLGWRGARRLTRRCSRRSRAASCEHSSIAFAASQLNARTLARNLRSESMPASERALGWYHIAGAVIGGGATIWAWSRGALPVGNSIEIAAIPFALSCAAGTGLIRGTPRARALAYITQLLQIPIVVLPAVTWRFCAGAIISITITAQGAQLFGGIRAEWLVGRGSLGNLVAALGVNLAPAIVMILLARAPATMPRASRT
jgi:hypothetical protein